MKDIQEKLFNIFISEFAINPNDIKLDSRLYEDFNIDVNSTDAVQLLFNIENEFGIEIPNEEFSSVISVADIIKVIKNNMKKE